MFNVELTKIQLPLLGWCFASSKKKDLVFFPNPWHWLSLGSLNWSICYSAKVLFGMGDLGAWSDDAADVQKTHLPTPTRWVPTSSK